MNYVASAQTGTRALWSRWTILAVLALSLTLLALGCSDDDGTVTYPTEPPAVQDDWLYGVSGTAADNVYVCGSKGSMFHYDGTDWSLVDLGTDLPITNIWGPGDDTLLACGHNGALWHNTGGTWSGLDSGTSENLYGIGNYAGSIYTCGANGALRLMTGGTWTGSPEEIILRDPTNGTPEDTLSLNKDIISLVTVSYYGFGGAMKDPLYDGDVDGLLGTAGIMLGVDDEYTVQYDWRARRIKGSQDVQHGEWVWCALSDPVNLNLNYIGTSEGWLFELTQTSTSELVWSAVWPKVTEDIGKGLVDMWRAPNNDLYMVSDEGQIIYQSEDYAYSTDSVIGVRTVLYNQFKPLTGIWGADQDNIFVVGYDNKVYQCSHDPGTSTFDLIETELTFPEKSTGSGLSFYDATGRPRH